VPGSENIIIISVLQKEQEKGNYRALKQFYDVWMNNNSIFL
jgi:hypothetical protein